MNTAEAKATIARYAVSHFHRFIRREDRITMEEAKALAAKPATKDELVASMLENIEEAKRNVKATARRLEEAKLDGLLDRDVLASVDKELRSQWIAAVMTVKGDYDRARSELQHWREYAGKAIEGKLPTWKPNREGVVKVLADGKQLEPLEQTDEEANEAKRRIAQQLEEWKARNGWQAEPQKREPGEDDDVSSAVPF